LKADGWQCKKTQIKNYGKGQPSLSQIGARDNFTVKNKRGNGAGPRMLISNPAIPERTPREGATKWGTGNYMVGRRKTRKKRRALQIKERENPAGRKNGKTPSLSVQEKEGETGKGKLACAGGTRGEASAGVEGAKIGQTTFIKKRPPNSPRTSGRNHVL